MNDEQGKIVIVSLLQLPEYLKNKGFVPERYIEEEEILVVKPKEDDEQ